MVFDAPNRNGYACAACNGNKSVLDNMSEEEIAKKQAQRAQARNLFYQVQAKVSEK